MCGLLNSPYLLCTIGFFREHVYCGMFLDIEGAYNNVSVGKVVNTLDFLGVGTNFCKYLWNFLSERHLILRDQNIDFSGTRWTDRGLAQGDPLSPLLFNIATYQICHKINKVHISQYADDFVLYIRSKSLQDSVLSMQNSLCTMIDVLDGLGLEVSASKSKLCVFRKGHKVQHVSLSICGNQLSSDSSVKYLGMWLDRSLRWGKHIGDIVEKTQRFLNILKTLAGATWGVHPKHLRRLFISLIRSRMDYACFCIITVLRPIRISSRKYKTKL